MEAARVCGALIDGHVHLHGCFDVVEALDAAARNFVEVRSDLGLEEAAPGVIWLVEHDEEGASARLMATLRSEGAWQLDGLEGACLRISRSIDGARLVVILGQQVRTREDLEILVVGRRRRAAPGLTLMDSIEDSLNEDTVVMIPWGFGKWTGARGTLVRQAFERFAADGLRLADTGAHTRLRPELALFDRSRANDLPVLSGSDPFPFKGQHRAIGRTGFVIDSALQDITWPGLRSTIRSLKGQPEQFGSPRGLLDFALLQGRMQLRKRLGGR